MLNFWDKYIVQTLLATKKLFFKECTRRRIILGAIVLIIAVLYVLTQLAPHNREQLDFQHNFRNRTLSYGVVNFKDDASPYDKQQNFSSLGTNVTYKQNLSSREADIYDKKQPYPPPREVKIRNSQQQKLPIVVVEINQHLLNLSEGVNFEAPRTLTNVNKYVANLSSSQVKDAVAQMVEVSSLTSRVAQEQFLTCTGLVMLKKSNTLQTKSSISMPPSHQHCKTMSFKSSGPTVALVSYPGSGNSWVRQLLEASTGIYTGAVYCDSSYINAGMIGEGVQTNNVIAVKTHYDPLSVSKLIKSNKAIYIVRNPFDAILSEYNRAIAVSSKKYASLGNSHTLEVDVNYGMY